MTNASPATPSLPVQRESSPPRSFRAQSAVPRVFTAAIVATRQPNSPRSPAAHVVPHPDRHYNPLLQTVHG